MTFFRFRRSARSVALVGAGALAMSVLPATSASADHGTPFDLLAACEFAPESPLDSAGGARLDVVEDCLANWEGPDGQPVLQGTAGEANFQGNISRAQYAAVMVRIAAINNEPLPEPPAEATFPDVPTTAFFFNVIEQATALGIFEGTSKADVDDLDNDGDTEETLFDPNGSISFAQVVGTLGRLYRDTLGGNIEDDGAGNSTGLDCGFFNTELELLEGRSFFGPESTLPDDCRQSALRGEVFDAFAALLTYQVAVGAIETPHTPPPPPGQTGIVTEVGVATYTFVDQETGEEVTVTTDADDTFTVDGAAVSSAVFDSNTTEGDLVRFVDDTTEADADQHELTNRTDVDYTDGRINDVDALNNTFDIVEPVTGTVLRTVTYGQGEDTYTVDGETASLAAFEDDLQPGDQVLLVDTPDTDENEPEEFRLTNQTANGQASAVNHGAGSTTFSIGGFDFTLTATGTTAGSEEYSLDGDAAGFAAMQDELTDDDLVTVGREDDLLNVAVVNRRPDPVTGTVTETFTPGGAEDGGSIQIVIGADDATVSYESTATFSDGTRIVNEAEFEAALNAGDEVTYQAPDDATGTSETITLTNGSINGLLVQGVITNDNDAIDTETVDLVNEEGGIVFDDYAFPTDVDEPARFLINGVEVNAATFEGTLESISNDEMAATAGYEPDDTLAISIAEGVSTTFDLTTDNGDADA